MSKFEFDLKQEQILSEYLDRIYKLKKIEFERMVDINLQHQGIDISIKIDGETYNIDEKAQLHYLNNDLPTFTFELSYLNDNKEIKEGWLLDKNKLTHYYFLITGIFLKGNLTELSSVEDIERLKITSVNRRKLITHLNTIGLSKSKLETYDRDIRKSNAFEKNVIPELDEKKEGLIYYTKHLSEKPVNLQLRLGYLIESRIAKKFHYV